MTKKEEFQKQIEAFKQLLTNNDNTIIYDKLKAISDHYTTRTIRANKELAERKQNRNSDDLPL